MVPCSLSLNPSHQRYTSKVYQRPLTCIFFTSFSTMMMQQTARNAASQTLYHACLVAWE